MTNVITTNPIYIEAATIGVIMTTPLWIKKIVLVPNAHSDTATLKYWIDYPGVERVHKKSQAIETDANTLTSVGNFLAASTAATDVIHIYEADLAANIGTWEIATVVSDDAIDVLPGTFTVDASGVYSWKTYASYPLATMKSQATSSLGYELNFGGKGLYVPNLMVTAMSTSAVLYIYL
jgi:hypothetical protein